MADAARELARGQEITLLSGRKVRIVFSLYTLACIEEEFGSLDEIDKVFSAQGTKGQMIRTIGKLISLAIVGEKLTPDEALQEIAIEDMGLVMSAIQGSMTEGFQPPQAKAEVVPAAQATANVASFLGANSSTSGATSSTSHDGTSGI